MFVLEDAPALDSLLKYNVKVENGDVIVEADDAALSASRRKPACVKRSKDNKEIVVIIGGGASGAATAKTLRENNYNGIIRVVSREDYLPIDR
jgi:rhodanese-related sulfurtransferase